MSEFEKMYLPSHDYCNGYSVPNKRDLIFDNRGEFTTEGRNQIYGSDLLKLSSDSSAAAYILKRRIECSLIFFILTELYLLHDSSKGYLMKNFWVFLTTENVFIQLPNHSEFTV